MKDKPEAGEKQPKKTYSKPQLQKVKLTPEEAVLGGCKKSTAGPAQSTCNLVFSCYTLVT